MDFIKDTRGFRNNNPGNIRHGSPWVGLADEQPDSAFCTFKSVEYGIRAIHRLLHTYASKYGCTNIESIINRYAPPNENNTSAYINTVYDYMFEHTNPEDSAELFKTKHLTYIHTPSLKPVFIGGLIFVENGFQPFNFEFIEGCQEL